MDYDRDCEDLAELFIEDPPERKRLLAAGYTLSELDDLRRQLAQTIQGAIEDWFSALDEEIKAREKPLAKSEPGIESEPHK